MPRKHIPRPVKSRSPITSERRSYSRRPARPKTVIAFDGDLRRIPLPKLTAAVPCAASLAEQSGSLKFNGAVTHNGPDYVVFMCPGFGFGGAAPVIYETTANGYEFKGIHNFCWAKKCSDGSASTSTTSVVGSIATKAWEVTLEMSYEVLAFCGTTLACSETGTFHGTQTSPGSNPLDAIYNGQLDWKTSCCPDLEWKASITPGGSR